ncbi:hypothetical protein GS682_04950 [Nostoc sp. B(2019)]|nr:hypothetical protein [Nostoc sp. B(2019)]
MKGTVYLLNAKGTNRYKIGYTNRHFQARLTEIGGRQSPYPLVAIKTILVEDAHAIELALHRQFAQQRKHGEWFEFNPYQLRQVRRAMDKTIAQPIREPIPFLLMILGLLIMILPVLSHYQRKVGAPETGALNFSRQQQPQVITQPK